MLHTRRFAALSICLGLPVVIAALDQSPTAARSVSQIEFIGNRHFDAEILRDSLRIIRLGSVWNPNAFEADVELNLKRLLKEHGHIQCEVSWKEISVGDKGIRVAVQVSEGPAYRLGEITFRGVTIFSTDDLRSQFPLRPGDILNITAIKHGMETIRRIYSEQGYIQMSYLPRQTLDAGTRRAEFIFTLVEGARYRVAHIAIVGCRDQSEENWVRSVLPFDPGDFFRPSSVKASLSAISELGRFQPLGEKDYDLEIIDETQGLLRVIFWLKPKEL